MNRRPLRIGLIGDQSADVAAHAAIPEALVHASSALGCRVTSRWLATDRLASAEDSPDDCDGLWCVPGSPYRSMEGALSAIRHARERPLPFLGTCGGFQHAVLEFARSLLGITDAEHAESTPEGEHLVITPLDCALVGVRGEIHLKAGSRAASSYGALRTSERYHCRFGLDGRYRDLLEAHGFRVTGEDGSVDGAQSSNHCGVRVLELSGHPFYVATLFQPELSSTPEQPAPIVLAFVRAVGSFRRT
jgi:CTP synthase (UTP-ammonia lyase)